MSTGASWSAGASGVFFVPSDFFLADFALIEDLIASETEAGEAAFFFETGVAFFEADFDVASAFLLEIFCAAFLDFAGTSFLGAVFALATGFAGAFAFMGAGFFAFDTAFWGAGLALGTAFLGEGLGFTGAAFLGAGFAFATGFGAFLDLADIAGAAAFLAGLEGFVLLVGLVALRGVLFEEVDFVFKLLSFRPVQRAAEHQPHGF
jgi:hypothetical protein